MIGLFRETQIFICMSYLLSFAYLSGLQPFRKGSIVKTKYTCLSHCSVSGLSNLQPSDHGLSCSYHGSVWGRAAQRVFMGSSAPEQRSAAADAQGLGIFSLRPSHHSSSCSVIEVGATHGVSLSPLPILFIWVWPVEDSSNQ